MGYGLRKLSAAQHLHSLSAAELRQVLARKEEHMNGMTAFDYIRELNKRIDFLIRENERLKAELEALKKKKE